MDGRRDIEVFRRVNELANLGQISIKNKRATQGVAREQEGRMITKCMRLIEPGCLLDLGRS